MNITFAGICIEVDVRIDGYDEKEIEIYKENTTDKVTITYGELAYVPYIDSLEEGTYILKPTWVFDAIQERSDVNTSSYRRDAIDALTGEEVDIDNDVSIKTD